MGYADWILHSCIWKTRNIKCHITHKKVSLNKYYAKEIQGIAETNKKICELIEEGQPFMVGRLGNTELQTMVAFQKECHNIMFKHKMVKKIQKYSGFFPAEKSAVYHFVKLMENSCREIDVLGVWNNNMEDYIVNKYCPKDCFLGKLTGLEPWYSIKDNAWSQLLCGKKIVVVHPFESSIKCQLEVKDKLFVNNFFPECDIRIVKAVQTIAGNRDNRFGTWFEALGYMYRQVMKEEFDIAIIGCGAYGFPLASLIKKAGKSAIHLGGATQLLFGIKGKRWENHPIISQLFNEYWIYPLSEDIPNRNEEVENGCYWR